MAVCGVAVLSPDSLLIRLAGLSDNSLLFYRGLLPAIAISGYLLFYYGQNLPKAMLQIGRAGLLNAALFAIVNISFIYAIQRTSVANTLLVLSSAPVFAAVLSLIFLRENQRLTTWIIIACSLFGIFVIGMGSYSSNGLMGVLLALLCAIATACSAVLVRYKKEIDLVPSVVIGSLLTAAIALAQAPELSVSTTQFLYLGIIGFVLVPFAFVMLTIAPRYANSAEVQLVYLLESILGPLWVWWVIRETPTLNTFIGGSILLVSLFCFMHFSMKQEMNTKTTV